MKKFLLVIVIIFSCNLVFSLKLTEEEKIWLDDHPVIRIAPDPFFPPIEYFDKNNNYVGIAANFIELIQAQLNVEFEVVQCKNWKEVLQKAKSREVDMLTAAAQTPDRAEYMYFSEPYMEFPGVILSIHENKKFNELSKLYNRKVGIVSEYVWHEMISKDYPRIQIVEVKNIIEGLRQVSTEEIDAFMATLPVAVYYMEQEGIHNLVVAGETKYKTKLSILTRKDWPLLHSIITKAMNNIPESKFREITKKWITIKQESIFDNPYFLYGILTVILISFIVLILILVWNSTLRKRVISRTAELEKSRKTYHNIFENAQVGMFRARTEDSIMSDCNRQLMKMLGYENREEFIEKFIISEHCIDAEAWEKIQNEIKENGEISNFIARFSRRDSSVIWVKFSARINPLEGWVEGVAEDISEKKETEDELQKLKQDLEKKVKEQTKILQDKVNKLAESEKAMLFMIEDLNRVSKELKKERIQLRQANQELESFSYSVSHDLRSPLRAIDGFVEILMEDYVDNLDTEGKRIGNVIRDNAEKMSRLIDDLLAFSRLGRKGMSFSNIDMKNMVNAIYHEITSKEERERISFNIGDLPEIEADTNMMRQVWDNLISNAVKFTAKEDKPKITVTAKYTDEEVTYRIKDNGPGFNTEYTDKLFEVFQRLHSEKEFKGSGVGLAIVKRIIERHYGKIEANAKLGKGATFYFSLPKTK